MLHQRCHFDEARGELKISGAKSLRTSGSLLGRDGKNSRGLILIFLFDILDYTIE